MTTAKVRMKKPLVKKLERLTSHELLVTPKYTRWLEVHGNDPVYPEWVIERIAELLAKGDRERSGAFSASDSGKCMRRQVLGFLGAEATPWDMDKVATFLVGQWNHLMWQAAMLASGAIDEVEVPFWMMDYRSKGTGDGRGTHDEHGVFGWEHKSINGRRFKFLLASEHPLEEHVRQAHRYMLASGIRLWSITYDCKVDEDWKEFVVPFDEKVAYDVKTELKQLNQFVENEKLPPVLMDCQEKKGQYRNCPFRKVCLGAETSDFEWPEFDYRVADLDKLIRLPQRSNGRKR